MAELTESRSLYERAIRVMPGGVSSPVRAFQAVGGDPPFIVSGSGSKVTDADGNTYIDLVGSWGPLILGHTNPEVVRAVGEAASRGTSFGAPTADEVELAEMIVSALPSVDMVRFVNSGTEATMSALRLARAETGRTKVLKFSGCYHGHLDALLVSAGSGLVTLGMPDSPGVSESVRADTIVAAYNDQDALPLAFSEYGRDLAAVIVEPVAANMGVVPPAPGWLEKMRALCVSNGTLLIFDEVVTGFRLGWSGAQGMFGVMPDITTLGKTIGGGLPIGAYGGRRALMEQIAPVGPVYQAGTLSGNPLSMAAGKATLRQLSDGSAYEQLDKSAQMLEENLVAAAKEGGVAVTLQRVASMMTLFFNDRPVRNLDSAKASDTEKFKMFFHEMLSKGIYLPPSQFEAVFINLAHSQDDLDAIVEATAASFERIGS